MHPTELRKKLKSLNSSDDSECPNVDVNARTKRRGTFHPGRKKPLEFKDASQLPEIGLEFVEEEEKEHARKLALQKKWRPTSTTSTASARIPPKVIKYIQMPAVPMHFSESSSSSSLESPKRDAVDEVQRANELLRKFDTIQARIKKNLENIRTREQTRFNIGEKKHSNIENDDNFVEKCCCEAASSNLVRKIMEEIALNKVLHPEVVVDGDVKQLRTEIGQYKNVLKHGGDVDAAVAKAEEVSKQQPELCPDKCRMYLKTTSKERKETAVQYEGLFGTLLFSLL